MELSQPDVQLGKIFIVLWIGLMLFIIILIIVVYFNAKNEASNCDPSEINTEKSEKSSMGRTPKLFIAFLAITAFAVSTMNLTYKVNYFEKKVEKPIQTTSNLFGMIKNLQKKAQNGLKQNSPLSNSSLSETTSIKNMTEQSETMTGTE